MPQRQEIDAHFPRAGLDLTGPAARQPARPGPDGVYARSCAAAVNVRGLDPLARRFRGGSRTGLSRYIDARVAGRVWVVQNLGVVVTGGSGVPQYSQSGRVVNLLAVSYGGVFRAYPGSTAWAELANNTGETPPLNVSGVVFSAACVQKLWFADGINYVYADPVTGTVEPWTATAGTLPTDAENNTPRLICTWRGRVLLSGLLKDPQAVFASRRDVPTDFDYGAAPRDADMAFAFQTGNEGLIGDAVRCLIPWSDDECVIGCANSIHVLRGDPMDGGRLMHVTKGIGMAFGKPWCQDPNGVIYFLSSQGGVYKMVPGSLPQPVSTRIRQELLAIDTGENGFTMEWDEHWHGVHLWVTPLLEPGPTTHWFYEAPRDDGAGDAWWPVEYANENHNPLCSAVLDGNESGDRVVLIGCYDGYVRAVDPDAVKDDYTDIASEVVIGPILTKLGDRMKLWEVQATLAAGSADVTYSVHVGETAEAALAAPAVASGTWRAGRNQTGSIHRAGYAIFVKLSSTGMWALEFVRAVVSADGPVLRRGK